MRRRVKRFLIWLSLLILAALTVFAVLRSRYYPVIRNLAETQVKNTASDLINDAISKQIAQGTIQYDRIVYFEKDLDGRITALKTNIGEINRLKTDVLNIINDEVLAADESSLGIPLGSLFFSEFFEFVLIGFCRVEVGMCAVCVELCDTRDQLAVRLHCVV